MKFVDYVTVTVRSGKGGPGSVSFRREKYVPKGGPDGGDGGDGGSIIIEADSHLYTLLDLRYNRHHFARNGMPGEGSRKKGKDGDDVIIRVPVGTIIKNKDTGAVITEMVEPGERYTIAAGGKGGRGNDHFKSATRQAPRYAQPGLPGEELEIALELKLLADVGLVGFPNAGKSTLVATVSAAKPKIADYPFTTLAPSLGVVDAGDFRSFVIADIPGIIEGAHEGRGLGIQFLKHIERNAVLLFVIPVTTEDVESEYQTLLAELEGFSPGLLRKPRVVALSKIDLLDEEAIDKFDGMADRFEGAEEVVPVSAVAQKNIKKLKNALWKIVLRERGEVTI